MIMLDIEMPTCCDECVMCEKGECRFGYCHLTGEYNDSYEKNRGNLCPMIRINSTESAESENKK